MTGPSREGPDSPARLYSQLRQLLELEVGSGVAFAPRHQQDAAAEPESAAAPVPSAASPSPAPSPGLPPALEFAPGNASERLAAVAQAVAACQRCGLCKGRNNTVPGEGNVLPEIVFVGEGPGFEEDQSGRPFVGADGQLLDRMIGAMGLARSQVFIANVVKCRPPGNRAPEADEIAACLPYLEEQLAALSPKVICSLGAVPLRALSGDPRAGITRLRGQQREWRGIPWIPTFHPSYLLRNEPAKKFAWLDLQAVLAVLGREAPRRGA
ncbi:MAG: uracil-DNA glycosylase [Planctomycetota bacterium]|nr:MAG: uracil-DNA glycosylase [Planctomycetota bacterium]